ncbi:MAG: response regulator [Planctomycetes bacterium]|nr:response regulator [Planctomycetota bacterium]
MPLTPEAHHRLVLDWLRGESTASLPKVALIDLDILTRTLWVLRDPRSMERGLRLLHRIASAQGEPMASERRQLFELRCEGSRPQVLAERAGLIHEATATSRLDRLLAASLAAVESARAGAMGRAARWERRLAQEARAQNDHFFEAIARIARIARLAADGDPSVNRAHLTRARRLIERSTYGQLLTIQLTFEVARQQDRAEDPEALWSFLTIARSNDVDPFMSDRAAWRAADLLAERGQPMSALALRLRVAQRRVLESPLPDRGRLSLDLASSFLDAEDPASGLRYARDGTALLDLSAPSRNELARGHAITAILAARCDKIAEATSALEVGQAHHGLLTTHELELDSLLVLAEVTLLSCTNRLNEAASRAGRHLQGALNVPGQARWTAELAREHLRLVRAGAGSTMSKLATIQDTTYRCAHAKSTAGLQEAYLASALNHASAGGDPVLARSALLEALRLETSLADADEADRKLVDELVSEHPELRTQLADAKPHGGRSSRTIKADLGRIAIELTRRYEDAATTIDALTRSRRRMSRIIDNLPVVAWSAKGIGQAFALCHSEGSLETIFGKSAATLLRSPESWLDQVAANDQEIVRQTLADVERHLVARTVEFWLDREDDPARRLEMHVMPVLGGTPEEGVLHGIMTDVTERWRLNDELRRVHKMDAVGQLADGIAHDFNNILGSVLSAASLLSTSLSADPDHQELLKIIEQAALRGEEMISRLRSLSKRKSNTPIPIEITHLLKETIEMSKGLIDPKIVVRYAGEDPELYTRIVPAAITQAILNVIVNAAESGPEDGQVVVAAQALDEDRLQITVSDTGRGMDDRTLERIYDPFFTNHAGSTDRGLGMTTVYRAVCNDHGEIHISSAEGQGTVVTIVLPRIPAPPRRERKQIELAEGSFVNGGKLLLIDDDPQLRAVGQRILSTAGFEVVTASDGRAGIEAFEACPDAWALVVCDLRMPRADGEAVVRAIRARHEQPPILLMTGCADEAPQAFADRYVNVGVIRKPFTAAAFIHEARVQLEASSRGRDVSPS